MSTEKNKNNTTIIIFYKNDTAMFEILSNILKGCQLFWHIKCLKKEVSCEKTAENKKRS